MASSATVTRIVGFRAYEAYIDAHKNDRVIVFLFSANWCDPCKQLLDKLQTQKDIPALHVAYIDINAHKDNTALAEDEYRVDGLPTIVFARVGRKDAVSVLRRMEGYADPVSSWREFTQAYRALSA